MKHLRTLGFSLVCLGVAACKTTDPAEFQTFHSDGCTGFPDGPGSAPGLWCADCQYHDFLYWKGGTFAERKEADQILRDDLRERGYPVAANIAYLGVRAFGSPHFPTPWRWGYGWKEYPRRYRPLTEKETARVKETLNTVPSELRARRNVSDE